MLLEAELNVEYHKNITSWLNKNANDLFQILGEIDHPCEKTFVYHIGHCLTKTIYLPKTYGPELQKFLIKRTV